MTSFSIFATSLFLPDFAQIYHEDATWLCKQKSKIVLRLIEKWSHSDVITDLEDPVLPKCSSKNMLQWEYETLYFAEI